jgi:hypothetical protein
MSSLPLPGNDVNFAAMAITFLSPFKNRVKRKARGMLRHDYLVPMKNNGIGMHFLLEWRLPQKMRLMRCM